MLLRPGGIPSGDGWAFELKYDGFRAIVSTENGLQIRSRRAWNMSDRVPELRELPPGLVLDGELVAFNDGGAPHWPLVVERVLHGNTAIPLTFVAFDLLRVDGHNLTCNPWSQRRTLLEGIWVDRQCARLADVFDDGEALFDAVVSYGWRGSSPSAAPASIARVTGAGRRSRTRPTGGASRRSSICSVGASGSERPAMI